jgi:hypothetical protein
MLCCHAERKKRGASFVNCDSQAGCSMFRVMLVSSCEAKITKSEDGVEDDLHYYCTCFYCLRLGADKGARWWRCGTGLRVTNYLLVQREERSDLMVGYM